MLASPNYLTFEPGLFLIARHLGRTGRLARRAAAAAAKSRHRAIGATATDSYAG
ncbi:hypothetical protein [Sphingomonas sp. NBWT7]|uniref:hypothetical protein n=1 Tax=Sphingomonas sp. NBWT7 TaxID=2596913 RepID=UPI0016270B54|nr:hypothetical protein [Sphingomonas sp. NBWT7]